MSTPNYSGESIDRIKKLERIRSLGVNPFANRFDTTHQIWAINSQYSAKLEEWKNSPFRSVEDVIATPTSDISIAGRVVLHRSFGKICFATIADGSDRIQILFSRENCSILVDGMLVNLLEKGGGTSTTSDGGLVREDSETPIPPTPLSQGGDETITAYKFAEKLIDLGDFIGVTGELFYTHKWELTLFVSEFTFLTKAIRPLPEKFHGLSDTEMLYRERNLDLVTNDETFARFRLRSKVIREMRRFFESKGFDEVETAILQAQAGGAMARTFSTHHNDLDHDFVLRISLELDLKRTIGGGFSRVFEIGKNFRNEGTDPSHLQEFTMCEWYAAYADLDTNKKWTEEMFHHIVATCLPSPVVQVMNKSGEMIDVDLGVTFASRRFPELLLEYAGVDMFTDSMEQLQKIAKEVGVEKIWGVGRANLLDDIYKKTARAKLIQPTFVFDYPEDLKPLARPNGDGTACCYQLVINGWEVVNSYGELIDPLVQRQLFEVQSSAKAGWDEEAMEVDEVFLKAMEHGFPPMTGSGFGIDRLVTLFTGQGNLRDVVLFPTMRPIPSQSEEKTEK